MCVFSMKLTETQRTLFPSPTDDKRTGSNGVFCVLQLFAFLDREEDILEHLQVSQSHLFYQNFIGKRYLFYLCLILLIPRFIDFLSFWGDVSPPQPSTHHIHFSVTSRLPGKIAIKLHLKVNTQAAPSEKDSHPVHTTLLIHTITENFQYIKFALEYKF